MNDTRAMLSVVMAVYNGAATLRSTLDSVLSQSFRDFEFVIVDDGSWDETPRILSEYAARDSRVRVIAQENSGLTRALSRGCGEARGEFIARQDCGDRSLPGRLKSQLELLRSGRVLVSCSTRFVSPEGDFLYVATLDGPGIRESLLHDGISTIRSLPHHGSAMFRRDAYEAAGGYRVQFSVAQDLDLWIRLAAKGSIAIAPDVLYEAVVDPRGISSTSREAQFRVTELAIAMRDGADEDSSLATAAGITRARNVSPARGYYFIASLLRKQRNPRWRRYMWRAAMALFVR